MSKQSSIEELKAGHHQIGYTNLEVEPYWNEQREGQYQTRAASISGQILARLYARHGLRHYGMTPPADPAADAEWAIFDDDMRDLKQACGAAQQFERLRVLALLRRDVEVGASGERLLAVIREMLMAPYPKWAE